MCTGRYKAVFIHGDFLSNASIKVWDDEKNVHGTDGWEAFAVTPTEKPNPGRWVYFKRPSS